MKIDQEITEKKINDWWVDLEYLEKIRVVLLAYPKLNIFSIENQGINNLWRTTSLERKKELYEDAWKRS